MLEVVEERGQFPDGLLIPALRHTLQARWLHQPPKLGQLPYIPLVELGDAPATAPTPHDKPRGLQALQRFPDRRTADAERLGKLAVAQQAAWWKIATRDRTLYLRVDHLANVRGLYPV